MMQCQCCLNGISEDHLCKSCSKKLFGTTRKVKLVLDFDKKDFISIQKKIAPRLSISGVQDKISLRLDKDTLIPVETGGEYILKPVPGSKSMERMEDIPANEHLSMVLAGEFNIDAAHSTIVHFSDGEPAYLVRRFDRTGELKKRQEDFCQLSNRSPETHGKNYKYDGTYEELGKILKIFCGAYKVEVVKLFRQLVYSYIIGNADAHMKNFSLLETEYGDFVLSPAYDLLSSSAHLPNDSRTALEMFVSYESEFFQKNGFYTGFDFLKLGEMYGMPEKIIKQELHLFLNGDEKTKHYVDRSFMSREGKEFYLHVYKDRIKALGMGLKF